MREFSIHSNTIILNLNKFLIAKGGKNNFTIFISKFYSFTDKVFDQYITLISIGLN
jgi:hypothetical protein